RGALVDLVGDAVAVGVEDSGRRRRIALLARRQRERQLGVLFGDGHLLLGRKVLAVVELGARELEVRLRHGQLARRAAVGAVLARLTDDVADAVGAPAQIIARTAGETQDGDERGQLPHSRVSPRSRASLTASCPKSRDFLPHSMASW